MRCVACTQLKLDPVVLGVLHDDHLGNTGATSPAPGDFGQGLLNTGNGDEPLPSRVLLTFEATPPQARLHMSGGHSVTEQSGRFDERERTRRAVTTSVCLRRIERLGAVHASILLPIVSATRAGDDHAVASHYVEISSGSQLQPRVHIQ